MVRELQDATGSTRDATVDRAHQLEQPGLTCLETSSYGEYEPFPAPHLATRPLDYPRWKDLLSFCSARGFDVSELVVDLRFDLLD